MKFREPRRKQKSPEGDLSKLLMHKMRCDGWWCKKLHGSIYQSGLPDIVAIHPNYGTRWIETKSATGVLSPEQMLEFSKMHKAGARIALINKIEDYPECLLGPPNKEVDWFFKGSKFSDCKKPKGM